MRVTGEGSQVVGGGAPLAGRSQGTWYASAARMRLVTISNAWRQGRPPVGHGPTGVAAGRTAHALHMVASTRAAASQAVRAVEGRHGGAQCADAVAQLRGGGEPECAGGQPQRADPLQWWRRPTLPAASQGRRCVRWVFQPGQQRGRGNRLVFAGWMVAAAVRCDRGDDRQWPGGRSEYPECAKR